MKKNQPKHPKQVQLFQQVTALFKNRAAAIEDYQSRFHCGNSTARAHFSGTNAITYDHYVEVVRAYNLEDSSCFNGLSPSGKRYQMVRVLSTQTDMDEYLSVLEQDLVQCAARNSSHIYQIVGHIPVFMFGQYQYLTTFFLYNSLQGSPLWPANLKSGFHRDLVRHPKISKWLDQCSRLSGCYQQILSTECWLPCILDQLLSQIRHATAQGLIQDKFMLIQLFNELFNLTDSLSERVTCNIASIHTNVQEGDYQRLNHEVNAENMMLATSNGTDFLYVENKMHQLFRYRDEMTASEQHQAKYRWYFDHDRPRMPVTANFFIKIQQSIEQLSNELIDTAVYRLST
jgi:hypothetical protein